MDKLRLQELSLRGFTIIPDVIDHSECKIIGEKLDILNDLQEKEYGIERLEKLGEKGIIRSPMAQDLYFMNLIQNNAVLEYMHQVLGGACILHLQNGLVLKPKVKFSQTRLHRDIPFLNYTGTPTMVNAFWFIDDFTKENGATWVVPYSHGMLEMPSDEFIENNMIQMEGRKGSVALFDSRLLHKTGFNTTTQNRKAVNHIYSKSHIKQQIDLAYQMQGIYDLESKTSQLLGLWAIPPKSVKEFRSDKRSYRSGQY